MKWRVIKKIEEAPAPPLDVRAAANKFTDTRAIIAYRTNSYTAVLVKIAHRKFGFAVLGLLSDPTFEADSAYEALSLAAAHPDKREIFVFDTAAAFGSWMGGDK